MTTAVEWLLIKLYNNDIPHYFSDVIQEAKEMEREQILDAFWNGDNSDCISEQNSKEFAEQYYNETYGDLK